MNIHIETERFIIRDLEEFDTPGIFALDTDPEVHKYLGNNPITKIQQAKEVIKSIRNQYVKNGIGRWAIIDKQTNEFIGWTGLKYEEHLRENFSYYDIGYRLRKKYWGMGIATETAMESLTYGFNTLELPEICAAADINNIASNKILTKIGLKFVEKFDFEGIMHNWYKINKFDWLRHNVNR